MKTTKPFLTITSICLTGVELESMKEEAKKQHRSMSAMIRKLFADHMATKSKEESAAE